MLTTVILAFFMLILGGLIAAAVFAGYQLYKAFRAVAVSAQQLSNNVASLMPMFQGEEFRAAMSALPHLLPRVTQGVQLLANMQGTLQTFNQFMFNGPSSPATPPTAGESKIYPFDEAKAAEMDEQEQARRQGVEYDPTRSPQTGLPAVDVNAMPSVSVGDVQTTPA